MHPVEALLVPLGKAFRNRRAGEAGSLANSPELATDKHFTLTSPAFREGEIIPAKYCGVFIGSNVSPALEWSVLPAGTQDVLLLLEDVDGPGALPRVHTIAAFAPIGDGLAEGALNPPAPDIQFLPRGRRPGSYAGPRPLPGHGTHHYRFHLYALDAPLDLNAVAEPSALPAAVAGHVLASGMLTGTRTS